MKSMYPCADYHYEIAGKVLVIYDLDAGGRSLTNDMPHVLNNIFIDIDYRKVDKIIYRDSQGVFDGVNHDLGVFKSFYPVNETELEKAIAKVANKTKCEVVRLVTKDSRIKISN